MCAGVDEGIGEQSRNRGNQVSSQAVAVRGQRLGSRRWHEKYPVLRVQRSMYELSTGRAGGHLFVLAARSLQRRKRNGKRAKRKERRRGSDRARLSSVEV